MQFAKQSRAQYNSDKRRQRLPRRRALNICMFRFKFTSLFTRSIFLLLMSAIASENGSFVTEWWYSFRKILLQSHLLRAWNTTWYRALDNNAWARARIGKIMFWLNKLAQKRCFFLHFAQMVTVVVDVAHVLFFNVIQKCCRFHCMCEECRQLPARFLMSCMRACVHTPHQLILILEPIQTKLFYLSTPKRKKREKNGKRNRATSHKHKNIYKCYESEHFYFRSLLHSIPVYVYVDEINRICLERGCDWNT